MRGLGIKSIREAFGLPWSYQYLDAVVVVRVFPDAVEIAKLSSSNRSLKPCYVARVFGEVHAITEEVYRFLLIDSLTGTNGRVTAYNLTSLSGDKLFKRDMS